jgi:hypothetical protein
MEDQHITSAERNLSLSQERNLGPMVTIIWNEMDRAFVSFFVMDEYHPKGDEKNHHLRRAASMQRLFMDIQNLHKCRGGGKR